MVAGCVVTVFSRRQPSYAPWNAPKAFATDPAAVQHRKNVMWMKRVNVFGIAFIISRLRWEERRN